MTKPKPKPWPCGREKPDGKMCEFILGYIVNGELTFEGRATTDSTNVTILCPECGQGKIWFPQPQKIMAAFGKALVDEIQFRVMRRSERE